MLAKCGLKLALEVCDLPVQQLAGMPHALHKIGVLCALVVVLAGRLHLRTLHVDVVDLEHSGDLARDHGDVPHQADADRSVGMVNIVAEAHLIPEALAADVRLLAVEAMLSGLLLMLALLQSVPLGMLMSETIQNCLVHSWKEPLLSDVVCECSGGQADRFSALGSAMDMVKGLNVQTVFKANAVS